MFRTADGNIGYPNKSAVDDPSYDYGVGMIAGSKQTIFMQSGHIDVMYQSMESD